MKIKRIISAFALMSFTAFIFFSCASTPEESAPSEDAVEILEDTPDDPVVYENDSENESEEISEPELNEPEAEPAEKILEPVPDEEGIFVSEENPLPSVADTEQKDDLPLVDIDDVPLISENTAEDTKTSEESVQTDSETHIASVPQPNKSETAESEESAPGAFSSAGTRETTTSAAVSTQEESSAATEDSAVTVISDSDTAEFEEETPEEKEIIPSREVTIKNNQYLDIVYPGTGWVYLGETDGGTKMRYFGRKLGSSDTSFSLRSREEGSAILHFYKNDALTGEYIDDYLAVTIKGKATDSSRAQAPSYAEAVPPKPDRTASKVLSATKDSSSDSVSEGSESVSAKKQSSSQTKTNVSKTTSAKKEESAVSQNTNTKESAGSTVIQNTTGASKVRTQESASQVQGSSNAKTKVTSKDTDSLSSDEILNLAQQSYSKGKFSECLAYLDDFFEKTASRIDEGLYLKGQTLESNSSVRNIKAALEAYEELVQKYPQSVDWEKASARITYLKRFYFNIR